MTSEDIGLVSEIFNGTTSIQEVGFKMVYKNDSEPSNFNENENYAESLVEEIKMRNLGLQRGKGGKRKDE